jgi:glycosyltransferase involved in cell wall biosynthesis
MIGALVNSRMPGVELQHLPIRLSSDDSEVGVFRGAKVLKLFLFVFRVAYARFTLRPNILYYAPELEYPRTTVLRDATILASTRFLFAKTILHLHAIGFQQICAQIPRWQRWLLRRGLLHADGVIRLSHLTPEDGQHLLAKREFIVPNGIDDLGRDLALPRVAAEISADRPLVVLFVARLSESKGLWIAIEACAKAVARGISIRLDVMGDFESAEFEAGTRAKVSDLKLDARVRFLGPLAGADKVAAFAQADVLCHPTFKDSFGLVIVEAMACGLPVVVTRWVSTPLIVDDEKTGFLVEPHDSDAVADRLTRLAEDAGLRVRMGAAGRDKFLREFTMGHHLERMRAVFLDVGGQPLVMPSPNTPEAFPGTPVAMSV